MPNRFDIGFTTQPTELKNITLETTGDIPTWLRGTLVRNGPGQFEVGKQSYTHWFDGLAMLRSFTFDDGQVRFSNRYLNSHAYHDDNETQQINYRGFAVDPCMTLFEKSMAVFREPKITDNAVINTMQAYDKMLAVTENTLALEFDLETLGTIATTRFHLDKGQDKPHTATAHPHYDKLRGMGYNYMLFIGARHEYRFYQQHGTRYDLLAKMPVRNPTYSHSFGMSENYLILVEYPFKLPLKNMGDLVSVNRPFIESFEWQPEQGTRFLILNKNTGEWVHEAMGDSIFAFHHINAYEHGDKLIIDLCAYDDTRVIDDLYLASLRGTNRKDEGGVFMRCTVSFNNEHVEYEVIGDEQIELPRINYKHHAGQRYHYAYGCSFQKGKQDFIDQLAKFDLTNGDTLIWKEDACYPSEPVFVAAPDAIREDEGVILSAVLDARSGTSFLLVLDAKTFTELGRAHVPIHLPFDFHGMFYSP